VLVAQGEFAGAVTAYRQALAVDPSDILLLHTVARLLANAPDPAARRVDEAITLATRAVRLAPRDARCSRLLGVIQYRAGRFGDAILAFEATMNLPDGGVPGDWLYMAMAQAKAGHREEARTWYRKTVAWLEERPWETEFADLLTEAKALLAEVGRD
jgi:tetratricopeptide (TPR) repeat protein